MGQFRRSDSIVTSRIHKSPLAALLLAALASLPGAGAAASVRPQAVTSITANAEQDCRRRCGEWLLPQCSPQTMRRGENALECVSRLAPIFDACVARCRSE